MGAETVMSCPCLILRGPIPKLSPIASLLGTQARQQRPEAAPLPQGLIGAGPWVLAVSGLCPHFREGSQPSALASLGGAQRMCMR